MSANRGQGQMDGVFDYFYKKIFTVIYFLEYLLEIWKIIQLVFESFYSVERSPINHLKTLLGKIFLDAFGIQRELKKFGHIEALLIEFRISSQPCSELSQWRHIGKRDKGIASRLENPMHFVQDFRVTVIKVFDDAQGPVGIEKIVREVCFSYIAKINV